MNFDEFKAEIADQILNYLPERYIDAEVKVSEVIKNNDQHMFGLTIHQPDTNITPTIYLEPFFEQFNDGREMDAILAEIAHVQMEHETVRFDINSITDFDTVKDNITVKLIGLEGNDDYLKDKPHTIVEDLAVVYRIDLDHSNMGNASVPITNHLMENFGLTTTELHTLALANMEMSHEAKLMSMQEMMRGIMEDRLPDTMSKEEKAEIIDQMIGVTEDQSVMYVLTNEEKFNGAAELLSDKVMDMVRDRLGDEFFILPSSVHEVIILPKSEDMTLEALEQMVQEVNATQVSPEERLSDHVYTYDAQEKQIVRADRMEEIKQEREADKPELKGADKDIKEPMKDERAEGRVSFKEKLAEKKDIVKANDLEKKDAPKVEQTKNKAAEIA